MRGNDKMLFTKQKPTSNSVLSEFMRNGSAKEHKRVFKKVIEESIRDQQKIIEQAERIEAETERRCSPKND